MSSSICHAASQTGRTLLRVHRNWTLHSRRICSTEQPRRKKTKVRFRTLCLCVRIPTTKPSRLGRFGTAHFVHVTDGAPRNAQDSRWHAFASWREYRAARAKEFRISWQPPSFRQPRTSAWRPQTRAQAANAHPSHSASLNSSSMYLISRETTPIDPPTIVLRRTGSAITYPRSPAPEPGDHLGSARSCPASSLC
jgi:hypothetical protein